MVDKKLLGYAAVGAVVGAGAVIALGRMRRKNPKRLGSGRRKNPSYGSLAVSPSRRVLMAAHFRRQTPEKIRQSLAAIRLKIKELSAADRSMVGLGLSRKNMQALIAEQRVTESIAERVLREKTGVRQNPGRQNPGSSKPRHLHDWKPIPNEMGKYRCAECKSVGKREGGSIVVVTSPSRRFLEWDAWPKHRGTRRVSWRGDTYGVEDVTYRDRDRENPTKRTAKRKAKTKAKRAKRPVRKYVAPKTSARRAKKPFQVESRRSSKRFATKAQAIAYAKKLKSNGHSSRVAGPNGPLAMFAGVKRAPDRRDRGPRALRRRAGRSSPMPKRHEYNGKPTGKR